jgi:hypothetical protein
MPVSLIKQLGMPESEDRLTVTRPIEEHEPLIMTEEDPAKVMALYETFNSLPIEDLPILFDIFEHSVWDIVLPPEAMLLS